MNKILWLDDLRNPFLDLEGRVPKEEGVIHWVLDYSQFVLWIEKHGLPDLISFDHDLGELDYTEAWRSVKGYENFYEVSNYGRVKSLPRNTTSGGILVPMKNEGGLSVMLRNSGNDVRKTIHRLVGESFIPNPDNKLEINHKDGNRWNNEVSNLEWVTRSENIKHAHDNIPREYSAYGENHGNSISVSQYTKSGLYVNTYGSVNEAGRQLSITFTNIAKCARGERANAGGFIWKYEGKPPTVPSQVQHIPKEEKDYTCRFFIPQKFEKTGKDCAQYLVDYCIDKQKPLPRYLCHSANPVGRDNILGLLDGYKKYENSGN